MEKQQGIEELCSRTVEGWLLDRGREILQVLQVKVVVDVNPRNMIQTDDREGDVGVDKEPWIWLYMKYI